MNGEAMAGFFLRRVYQFYADESGIAAIVAVLMLPVMLGMGGLAVDASSWFMDKRNLQTAADAAALAAAYEIANGTAAGAESAALKEAVHNGFIEADGVLEMDVTEDVDGKTHVTVELSQSANLWFSKIFIESVEVGAGAEAEVDELNDGSACILSLDETEDQALKVSGNVEVSMPNCGIAVNSESDEALYLNGSVLVDVDDVRIHGDYDTVGSVDFQYNSLKTGADTVADPYADLDVPAYSSCTAAQKRAGPQRVNSNATLSPGVYCGGITITGNNNITFEPGIYIIDGGSFNVTGGGALTGEGVSFVLTNSAGSGSNGTVSISGGRSIDISAPGAGEEMEGVAFYQDRDAPSTDSNSIVGTADVRIDGAAYFPSQEITIGGNASSASSIDPCSRIIGRTVTLHGNPLIANTCNGSAARNIVMPGTNAIRLVN